MLVEVLVAFYLASTCTTHTLFREQCHHLIQRPCSSIRAVWMAHTIDFAAYGGPHCSVQSECTNGGWFKPFTEILTLFLG